MTKYLVYKVIDVDGFNEEGKKIIHDNTKDGFTVVHSDYFVGVVNASLEEKL